MKVRQKLYPYGDFLIFFFMFFLRYSESLYSPQCERLVFQT